MQIYFTKLILVYHESVLFVRYGFHLQNSLTML